jgi:hypothetical protein
VWPGLNSSAHSARPQQRCKCVFAFVGRQRASSLALLATLQCMAHQTVHGGVSLVTACIVTGVVGHTSVHGPPVHAGVSLVTACIVTGVVGHTSVYHNFKERASTQHVPIGAVRKHVAEGQTLPCDLACSVWTTWGVWQVGTSCMHHNPMQCMAHGDGANDHMRSCGQRVVVCGRRTHPSRSRRDFPAERSVIVTRWPSCSEDTEAAGAGALGMDDL